MNPSDQTHSEYSEEWLSAYIDDELSDAQRAIVEQRVASDSEAQRLLNELQHMRGLIGQLPAWAGGLIDHRRAMERTAQSELSLHSESFEETLEQACRLHDPDSQSTLESQAGRVHAAGDVARRDVSWWRPVALAACLALLTGGGIWWWQSQSTITLATSEWGTESQDNLARDDTSALPQLRSAPEASGVEALAGEASGVEALDAEAPLQLGSRGAGETVNGMGGGMGGAMAEGMMGNAAGELDGARAAAPAQTRKAERLSEANVAAPSSAARSQRVLPAEEPAPNFAQQSPALRNADRTAAGGNQLLGSAGEEPGLAKRSVADLELHSQNMPSMAQPSRLASNAPRPAVQLQLVHSAGWSAAEVTQALQRLAPLVNVPLAASREQGATEQNQFGRAAEIPIALIAQRPATGQAAPLMEVLSQQPVALQPVAPSAAKDFLGYLWPQQTEDSGDVVSRDKAADESAVAGSALARAAPIPPDTVERPEGQSASAAELSPLADSRPAAPTVALFVLREEAEQILQAARQSGEVLSNPVWITPASGSTTPEGPKQQVVLLFTPQ